MIAVSALATSLVDKLGLTGVAVGVALNGLGVPGISEVLLPLAGVAARQGSQNLVEVLLAAMVGQLAGSVTAYFIGRYGGIGLVERYGRYILVTSHDLHRAQGAFERWGRPLVLVGAFIPGLQGFMAYIAGLAEVPFGKFLLYFTLGKVVWIGGLVGLGYALGNQSGIIDRTISRVGLVVLLLLVVGLIWYIRRQMRERTSHRDSSRAETD